MSKGKGVLQGAFDNSLNKTVNYPQPGSQSLWQKLVKLLPINKISGDPCVFLHCHTYLWLVTHYSQNSQLFIPDRVPFCLKNILLFSRITTDNKGTFTPLVTPLICIKQLSISPGPGSPDTLPWYNSPPPPETAFANILCCILFQHHQWSYLHKMFSWRDDFVIIITIYSKHGGPFHKVGTLTCAPLVCISMHNFAYNSV